MKKINAFDRKGQNTAEYAIVIALVVAAAVAMQTYVKRGMQGRVYDATNRFYDNIAQSPNWADISTVTADALETKQFEPKELSSKSTQEVMDGTKEKLNMAIGGNVTRDSVVKTQQGKGDYRQYDYNK
jgi:uncharacterized protein (UPF0333 family)